MQKKVFVLSDSAKLTKQIAEKFVTKVIKKTKGPYIFLLKGNLGSGKTAFTLGALSYFGVRPHAASPTFVLVKHYKLGTRHKAIGNRNKISDVYHVDAYRLRNKKDLDVLELPLENPHAIFFIEWPQQVKLQATKGLFVIHFTHGTKENERMIVINRQ